MWFLLIRRKKITFQYHWKSQQNKKGAKKPPSQPASSPAVWRQKSKKNKSLPRELWKTKGVYDQVQEVPSTVCGLSFIHYVKGETKKSEKPGFIRNIKSDISEFKFQISFLE